MSLAPLVTNPYMEGIYRSFIGGQTDEEYYAQIEDAVFRELGARHLEVLKLECGVGLSLTCRVDHTALVQLKVIRGTDALKHQTECCRIQKFLSDKEFPCTVPVGWPVAMADASLQFEEYRVEGEYRDSHDPSVMRLQAEHLARLHAVLADYRSDTVDDVARKTIPRDKVWQNPPQAVFSFDTHTSGDEAIRAKAAAAKAIFEDGPPWPLVLSHEDWSNKHFRFSGDRVSVIYDWDSLTRIEELSTVGLAAATFTATWYIPTEVFPTPAESRAFVDAYARAAGRTFSADELRVISAYSAYTLAYIARCVFAGRDGDLQGDAIERPFHAILHGTYF